VRWCARHSSEPTSVVFIISYTVSASASRRAPSGECLRAPALDIGNGVLSISIAVIRAGRGVRHEESVDPLRRSARVSQRDAATVTVPIERQGLGTEIEAQALKNVYEPIDPVAVKRGRLRRRAGLARAQISNSNPGRSITAKYASGSIPGPRPRTGRILAWCRTASAAIGRRTSSASQHTQRAEQSTAAPSPPGLAHLAANFGTIAFTLAAAAKSTIASATRESPGQ
jgi:hypothetical protein